jgi:hypothetical protein
MIRRMRGMREPSRRSIRSRLSAVLAKRFSVIGDINRKYAKPRIKMTRSVKLALLFLRLYLIFLVLVLAYKFASMAMGGG